MLINSCQLTTVAGDCRVNRAMQRSQTCLRLGLVATMPHRRIDETLIVSKNKFPEKMREMNEAIQKLTLRLAGKGKQK